MASLLKKNSIPLSHIISDPVFIVHSITPRKVWVDKKPTDDIEGYTYDCCSTETYRSVNVFVAGKKSVIPLKDFELKQDIQEPLFVEFENMRLSVFYSPKTKEIEDKIFASDVHVVEVQA